MELGEKIITNSKCDYPNKKGIVIKCSENGVCGVIQLENGMKLLTMDYSVDHLED